MAASKRHVSGTGGGPPTTIQITSIDERVQELIGNGSIFGHENISETAINLDLPDAVENVIEPNILCDEDSQHLDQNLPNLEDNSTFSQEILEDLAPDVSPHISLQPTPINKKKPRVRQARLQNAISTTDALSEIVKEKAKQKAEYQKNKLQLIEQKLALKTRLVIAKEKKAKAAERQATAVETIASHFQCYLFGQSDSNLT